MALQDTNRCLPKRDTTSAFFMSDASYNHDTQTASIAVLEIIRQIHHKEIIQCSSTVEAEWCAIVAAIEIAAREKYDHVVCAYDCLAIDVEELKDFFSSRFRSLQFLWLKREFLVPIDRIARDYRYQNEDAQTKALVQETESIEMNAHYKRLSKMSNTGRLHAYLACPFLPPFTKQIVKGLLANKFKLKALKDMLPSEEIGWLNLIYLMARGPQKKLLSSELRKVLTVPQYLQIVRAVSKEKQYTWIRLLHEDK
ncbi:hypothetical protein WCX49_01120 [Sulfurimonas sp. HSL-1656]|uniref:hypothetical protein n=1 Tax=Thiomicrolovo subterrani TaxID=3131934 RepID=UPI0031FA0B7B